MSPTSPAAAAATQQRLCPRTPLSHCAQPVSPPGFPGEGGGGSSRMWVRMLVDQMATEEQSHAAIWPRATCTGLKAALEKRRALGAQADPPDPRARGGKLADVHYPDGPRNSPRGGTAARESQTGQEEG